MPIFQNSVVSKYLKSQNQNHIATKWNDFKNHFHNPTIQENIRNSKEEQYQEGFLRDLFVKIFGYTLNPDANFNLTTEYKNVKDSKKADGAIIIDGKVQSVIELKGTNTTDLGKIESQAFGYKNNQPDCTYIITSNFEKIRFYIDNAIEHIEFNLFTLSEKEFELMYLLLAFENLSKGIAKIIKDESVSQEDSITKNLYRDYSQFKRELYHNLVALNTDFEAVELYEKSQKLLDRFLFIFFAEDRNLLPTNLIFRINKEWQQLRDMRIDVSLYDRYKIYFNDLNSGAKVTLPAFSESVSVTKEVHQIFAYNGGLFQLDEVLNSVKIDDAVLYHYTEKLSHYDFASEVDVNILGHIFENSLNELDEIKAQLEGQAIDKTKTKRKKDGVFYTPKYITKYIVDNTVGKLCIDKKNELQLAEEDYITDKKRQKKTMQALVEKLEVYRKWLLQLTICDPACGSGAFLNQALDFLIAEHRYIDELQAKLFGDAMVLSDVEKSILENNLFGVDLNEESVEIAKLSLWLRTAQPNRKLNDLNHNIKCGNSLIDDVAIAGDKAFNWQTAFPKIFKEINKKAWHITTAIHDSRTSQRMIDYKVREKRAMGTMPEPQINYLTDDDEYVIAQTIAVLVKELLLNILAFNVCKDHIHIVLVCEEEELDEIVRKIKGRTAREVNKSNGINPLVKENGEKSIPLWTQKFGCKAILDEVQLENTVNYVKTNRSKHNLPPNSNKGFKPLVDSVASDYEYAFRAEYKGGFDVVIGNPPYGVNFNEKEKNYLQEFDAIVPDFEIYIYFISLYKKILKKNSVLSYIFPNTFLSTLFGKKYRELIFNNLNVYQIIDLSNDNTFSDAAVRTCIFSFINNNNPYSTKLLNVVNKSFKEIIILDKESMIIESENILSLFSQNLEEKKIIAKLQKHKTLKNFYEVSQGLIPYDKYRGHDENTIKNRIWHADFQKDDTYKKELKGGDINRYNVTWNGNLWISYGDWLAAPRKPKFFISERILIREIISSTMFCGYSNDEYYNTPSAINIINESNILNLKYSISILNSKLLGWYVKKTSPKANKGLFPKILVNDIKSIPLVELSADEQVIFIEKANTMLSLNKELQEVAKKFQRTIAREFALQELSKKLQDWYLLSYGDFIKELAKKKVALSLSQKAEWEDYFNQEQKKAIDLKTNIDATDKQIDAMVYELYGLSEKEIAIVEKS